MDFTNHMLVINFVESVVTIHLWHGEQSVNVWKNIIESLERNAMTKRIATVSETEFLPKISHELPVSKYLPETVGQRYF